MHQFLRRHKVWLILAVITALAAFLRLYMLRTIPPGLYPDEAMNGNNITNALAGDGFHVFYPENGGREGLFIFVQGLSLLLFKVHTAWVLRLPSALIGIATVVLFFFVMRDLAKLASLKYPDAYGLVASFLLATSFWHVLFSRIGLRVISAPLMVLAMLWAVLWVLRKRSDWSFVVLGVVTGLGFYTYTAFQDMPLLLLAFWPLLGRYKGRGRQLALFAGALCCVLSPLLNYFIINPTMLGAHMSQVSVLNDPHPVVAVFRNILLTITMLFASGDENWRHNIAGQAQIFWPVVIAIILGVWVAGQQRFRLHEKVLLLWLGLAMLPVVFSNQALPHALRGLLMLPPLLGLATSGIMWFYQHWLRSRPAWVVEGVVALAAVWLSLTTYQMYFKEWAPRPEVSYAFGTDYTKVAQEILQRPRNEEKYVVDISSDNSFCGFPICEQSILFLTNSYVYWPRQDLHLHYLSLEEYQAKKDTLRGTFFYLQYTPSN